ncbi:MAG: YihY/virulence factor BrkB family protein [Gammaproteobacteria bacterium]|nr:MAG: YihY/virulence factor BrkB family protein [Gammaproteobacteria bacterium]
MLDAMRDLERRHLWERDLRDAPGWQRALVGAARIVVLLIRDIMSGELTLRAMSLVYTTLLSLVPLLALSFSILKGFGVQNQLNETLRTALAPLGEEKSAELTQNLITFVNNMNVGVLGAVGLVFLIYTVVSLMQKIEDAFNYAWRIRTPRTFGERFTTFLSAITIGPLLIFSAIAMTGSLLNTAFMGALEQIPGVGWLIELLVRLLPFAFVIAAFTFLYAFIPNTRVRIQSALVGGIVAGVLWELLSFGFASYAAGTSNYQLIYATFATAIFFMIWLYLNWMILLIGASIGFYHQHPAIVASGLREAHFNPRQNLRYSLSILARIGRRYYKRDESAEPYTLAELAESYNLPDHALERCLNRLVALNILAEADQPKKHYLPAVPFDSTTISEVVHRLEAYQPDATYAPPEVGEPQIDAIEKSSRTARDEALAGLTLKQLALNEVGT